MSLEIDTVARCVVASLFYFELNLLLQWHNSTAAAGASTSPQRLTPATRPRSWSDIEAGLSLPCQPDPGLVLDCIAPSMLPAILCFTGPRAFGLATSALL
jgi:hypothetical protein